VTEVRKKILAVVILFSLTTVVLTNGAYWLGERLDDDPGGAGRCAVLVLGYPTRADGSPAPVQRFRVSAGIDVYRANDCALMVFSGGAAHNRFVEGKTMADLARAEGIGARHIVIEDRARSTWQNVGCATPLVSGYARVLIVSESLHAFRARRYACRQDENLCKRVRAVGKVGPLSLWWWRVPGKLVYERHPERNAPICPKR
jgi:vancomycin permeability regulator SanA